MANTGRIPLWLVGLRYNREASGSSCPCWTSLGEHHDDAQAAELALSSNPWVLRRASTKAPSWFGWVGKNKTTSSLSCQGGMTGHVVQGISQQEAAACVGDLVDLTLLRGGADYLFSDMIDVKNVEEHGKASSCPCWSTTTATSSAKGEAFFLHGYDAGADDHAHWECEHTKDGWAKTLTSAASVQDCAAGFFALHEEGDDLFLSAKLFN